ncbi:hypothetical protein HNR46_003880 [Haloferula luteola]|uniref:Uncharacterized protein n=1 Tax=Haloferula luteola TaxID=595692 RepID=A0A840VIK3_9BACT|nr:hypothetical protein [Haloferula luteola]
MKSWARGFVQIPEKESLRRMEGVQEEENWAGHEMDSGRGEALSGGESDRSGW